MKTYRIEVLCEQDNECVLLRTAVPESVKDVLLKEVPGLDALIAVKKVASAPSRLADLIAARGMKKS